ncbi:MAG: TerC family protein [Phycisphaerae bacterium]
MTALIWIAFVAFVLAMLALDLGVFNRRARIISTREGLLWAGFCALLAIAFSGVVYYLYEFHALGIGLDAHTPLSGLDAAKCFLVGWIIEQSLSLDNVFVIALIFAYFGVALEHQHRVLFWGILGALIMRGVMIAAGAELIDRFHWVIYVLGAFLVWTGVKLLFMGDQKPEPEKNVLVRLARRFYPVTPTFEGEKFFSRLNGRRAVTPLFLVLLAVEGTDVVFAVDSIPAIFGITTDPFIVFTSNVFAILCLRSLYFALAGLMDKFRYLKVSLVFVLIFVGVKMLMEMIPDPRFHISINVSLMVVCGMLLAGGVASLFAGKPATEQPRAAGAQGNSSGHAKLENMPPV